MTGIHSRARAEQQSRAEAHVRKAGYARGGGIESKSDERREERQDERRDKAAIKSAVHKHERHDHPGKPLTKLKAGGGVKGAAPMARLDKRARGGRTGHAPVVVNVQTSNPAEKQMAAQQGLKAGVQMGARAVAQKLAGAGGGPGGPPPGAAMPPPGGDPNMPPRPPMKRGGAVKLTAGSGGAAGRLEKNNAYGTGEKVRVKGYVRRRKGGRV